MRGKGAQGGYRASEVAKIARVLPSTVRFWAGEWGGPLIRPRIEDKGIAGSRKLFSAANIVEVRVAQVLLQAGITRARVANIMAIRWPPAGGLDWFDPLQPLGKASALMVIREPPAAGTGRVFMTADDDEPQSWVGAMTQAAGNDFELIRVDVPDGWQRRSPADEPRWRELRGAQVIWLVNVKKIRDDIRARL